MILRQNFAKSYQSLQTLLKNMFLSIKSLFLWPRLAAQCWPRPSKLTMFGIFIFQTWNTTTVSWDCFSDLVRILLVGSYTTAQQKEVNNKLNNGTLSTKRLLTSIRNYSSNHLYKTSGRPHKRDLTLSCSTPPISMLWGSAATKTWS